MKYYFNRKLSDLVWSNYVASFCCLLATYFIFIEFKEERKVFNEGKICAGVIQKCNCTYSSRVKSVMYLKIEEQSENVALKVGSDFCFESVLGDTVLIKYVDENLPILRFNPELNFFSNKKLYLSIFCFLISIFFLLFRYEPKEYKIEKTMYQKGEKHKNLKNENTY